MFILLTTETECAAGVLPYDQIAGQNLSVTAAAILPKGLFAFFVIGGGICAIISSFLAVLAMIREPLSHMADDNWFPPIFRTKSSDGYPYFCFLLTYIVAFVPIIFSAIALKTGSVDASKLEEKRQEIIDAALKADK